MSNVHSIHGVEIPVGEPNEYCVAVCEDLLERARSGDIVGIAYAVQHSDGGVADRMSGFLQHQPIVGRLFLMAHSLSQMTLDDRK